ncbi:hypothetical protein Nepgr_016936 [Nepenthes gracilis]|uniref:GIR1-like zinc ribbon domain-containing protein n=1 Tax=Nepenthes gracilis TaxID=150966 RepID=A0AAD3SNI2_NEPGR|nr:hypothetical protein Nepgr_016936 [Nepenthes gracilis]
MLCNLVISPRREDPICLKVLSLSLPPPFPLPWAVLPCCQDDLRRSFWGELVVVTAPAMATLAESVEIALQNCSLSHHSGGSIAGGGLGPSSSPDVQGHHPSVANSNSSCSVSTTLLELNSHVSLPFPWEQCLDLKTGELYYINWRNGMKTKEDPRITGDNYSGDYYSGEDDDSYGSEGSSSASSFLENFGGACNKMEEETEGRSSQKDVLVVAGCRNCLMYFMVPKRDEGCPKCTGQLLHFR